MADNQSKIEDLEAIQDTGASQVAVDGISTTFDLDAIARRKAELQRQDEIQKTRRPRVSTIDLRNAF